MNLAKLMKVILHFMDPREFESNAYFVFCFGVQIERKRFYSCEAQNVLLKFCICFSAFDSLTTICSKSWLQLTSHCPEPKKPYHLHFEWKTQIFSGFNYTPVATPYNWSDKICKCVCVWVGKWVPNAITTLGSVEDEEMDLLAMITRKNDAWRVKLDGDRGKRSM